MHRPLDVNKQWDSLKQTTAWALQPPKESGEQIDLRGAHQETSPLCFPLTHQDWSLHSGSASHSVRPCWGVTGKFIFTSSQRNLGWKRPERPPGPPTLLTARTATQLTFYINESPLQSVCFFQLRERHRVANEGHSIFSVFTGVTESRGCLQSLG